MATAVPREATFRLQYVNCGKSRCGTCRGTAYAHGPYWYAFVHRKRGEGMRSFYLGKKRPAQVPPEKEAQFRADAERERAKKEAERRAREERDHRQKRTSPPPPPPGSSRPNVVDWARLGLSAGASMSDLKAAYRRLALKYHPDRPGGSKESMQALNAAYERLRRTARH